MTSESVAPTLSSTNSQSHPFLSIFSILRFLEDFSLAAHHSMILTDELLVLSTANHLKRVTLRAISLSHNVSLQKARATGLALFAGLQTIHLALRISTGASCHSTLITGLLH